MQNVVLIIHLLLALGLIGVVLLQRNEGGGLGMGGGGGGPAGARPATTPLAKFTWMLAGAFIVTSITLTIFAAQNSAGSSILDRLAPLGSQTTEDNADASAGDLDLDGLLPPPSADGSAEPLTPRAD